MDGCCCLSMVAEGANSAAARGSRVGGNARNPSRSGRAPRWKGHRPSSNAAVQLLLLPALLLLLTPTGG